MSDEETLKVYGSKVADYVAMTREGATRDPHLQAFMADLPAQARVLDLGCGPGFAAADMAAAGHRVTAMDPVPEMVAQAATHAGVQAVQGSFDDIAGKDIYDGVWANFSLLHAPREKMPAYLAAISHSLKPGGVFHIALKTGTGTKRDPIGRLYTYFEEDELTTLLTAAGMTVIARDHGRDIGLDGIAANWVALRAHA